MVFKKSLGPSEKPSMLDIAWAAGIYEGEGYCGKPTDSLRIVIVQKDLWLLEKLKRLFGGTIYRHKNKSCSSWRVFGPRARGFLLTIFTFMSPRRRAQIKNVILS